MGMKVPVDMGSSVDAVGVDKILGAGVSTEMDVEIGMIATTAVAAEVEIYAGAGMSASVCVVMSAGLAAVGVQMNVTAGAETVVVREWHGFLKPVRVWVQVEILLPVSFKTSLCSSKTVKCFG